MIRARVAIDAGGTFTDLCAELHDGDGVATRRRLKVPSTPDDPGRAVLDAIEALRREVGGGPLDVTEIRHGTTVATNALLSPNACAVTRSAEAGDRAAQPAYVRRIAVGSEARTTTPFRRTVVVRSVSAP